MKLGACLGVLLCCSLPLVAYADGTAPAAPADQGFTDEISEYLKGQSIQLGLSYSQGTFKMSKGNTQSQLTDNGRATAIIDYTSPEHVLGKFPMKYGDAVLGINLSGTFGQQHTQYALTPNTSAIIGQDHGFEVTGDYLAGDPFVYLRLGPLYPGTDSYWLVGYGPGVALYHFSGNPEFFTPQSNGSYLATSMQVSGTTKLFLYQTWRWQFHYGNWDLLFIGKQISGRKVAGYDTSYEDYGLGVAYSLHF